MDNFWPLYGTGIFPNGRYQKRTRVLSLEQHWELALLLSNQRTKEELLHHKLEIDKDNTVDYLIYLKQEVHIVVADHKGLVVVDKSLSDTH